MSATPSPESCTIHFTPKTYKEETEGKGTEPKTRGLNLVVDSPDRKWHVKLTFQGKLQSAQSRTFAKVTKRRKDLENLFLCIDFDPTQLLADTVTELLLTRRQDAQSQRLRLKTSLDTESEYAAIVNHLWLCIREDPFRVRFPVYNGSSTISTRNLSEIKKIQELGDGVHLVRVDSVEHVYKEVDRPLYMPRDSEVLELELRNLERMRGSKGVVRLVAAVVSDNPYRTAKAKEDDNSTSLQGILLEYHPKGTLQNALQSPKLNSPWHRLAVQITHTVDVLHQNGITHMDLKPRNIVLSKDLNAILIDTSGIGGTTRKWLSPEMRLLPEPLSQDFEARKQNDIWALGQILSAIAQTTCDEMERRVLRKVSLLATTEVLPRIPLRDIISILSPASTLNGVPHQNAAQSTSSGSKPPSVLAPR
jgi:serine/threonine protein kinase